MFTRSSVVQTLISQILCLLLRMQLLVAFNMVNERVCVMYLIVLPMLQSKNNFQSSINGLFKTEEIFLLIVKTTSQILLTISKRMVVNGCGKFVPNLDGSKFLTQCSL